jgi:hypothetical protein
MGHMEKEPRHRVPKGARYPIFLLGLLTIILGELVSLSYKAGTQTEAAVAALGFFLLILSVALR